MLMLMLMMCLASSPAGHEAGRGGLLRFPADAALPGVPAPVRLGGGPGTLGADVCAVHEASCCVGRRYQSEQMSRSTRSMHSYVALSTCLLRRCMRSCVISDRLHVAHRRSLRSLHLRLAEEFQPSFAVLVSVLSRASTLTDLNLETDFAIGRETLGPIR